LTLLVEWQKGHMARKKSAPLLQLATKTHIVDPAKTGVSLEEKASDTESVGLWVVCLQRKAV